MLSLEIFDSPPGKCSYLPEETSRLRYELVAELSPGEYAGRMLAGWRRFGRSLFRPVCPECIQCQPLRIDPLQFQPNQSQRRAVKACRDVTITIHEPSVTDEKLALFAKYHDFQADTRGWPERGGTSSESYFFAYVDNPYPIEEWNFHIGERLIAVGYVDPTPIGLSAIYFYYDPEERHRSLGTFNVLSILDAARKRGLPHVYLGYYVRGCRSLEYKKNFRPHELLIAGKWIGIGD